MAIPTLDRNGLSIEQPTYIVGVGPTGTPMTPVASSANGDLGVSDGLSSGGLQGALTLTTANTVYELKVGSSRLALRKFVSATPIGATVYWGFTNAVTTATGTPLFANTFSSWALDATDASAAIWVVCATAGIVVRTTESP